MSQNWLHKLRKVHLVSKNNTLFWSVTQQGSFMLVKKEAVTHYNITYLLEEKKNWACNSLEGLFFNFFFFYNQTLSKTVTIMVFMDVKHTKIEIVTAMPVLCESGITQWLCYLINIWSLW